MVFPARKSKFWLINYWAWDQLALTAANEIWCQRLPRGITNASRYYSYYCAKRKKEGKFSTIVCGSVHVAQKTLVVLVVQKVFKSRLVKKVFFTLLYDPLLQLLGFHLLLSFIFLTAIWCLKIWKKNQTFSVLFSIALLRNQTCWDASCQSIDEEEEATSGNYRLSTKHHVL